MTRTAQLDKQIAKLDSGAISIQAIAQKVGVTVAAVERTLRRLDGDTDRTYVQSGTWGAAVEIPVQGNHGTRGGYSAHRKNGEKSCDECRLAVNAYMREYKARKASK